MTRPPRRRLRNGLVIAFRLGGRWSIGILAAFITNPAGGAIVNAVGPIRQSVQAPEPCRRPPGSGAG
jgi:hypothetical protein